MELGGIGRRRIEAIFHDFPGHWLAVPLMSVQDHSKRRLIREGVGSLLLLGGAQVAALGLGIVLARGLGAEGYGIYAYALAWLGVLLVPAELVTSGSTPEVADLIAKLYASIITAGMHKASSIKLAEAAKVVENTKRDINIALINELGKIFYKFGY